MNKQQYLFGKRIPANDLTLQQAMLFGKFAAGGETEQTFGPADIVSFETKKARKLKSLQVSLSPIQDLNGYDSPWPAGGGKNLYDASTYPTTTKSGVTCTNNGDGSFTLNGTASADIYFDIFTNQYAESRGGTPLPQGSYRITGCPAGGGVQTYYMYLTPSYTGDYGNGGTNNDTTVTGGSIFVKSGYTFDNLVFRPMIRISTNGDDTWQPYSNECPITGRTGVSAWRTGKNLVKNTATSRSSNGVEYTVNADGSIKVYGSPISGSSWLRGLTTIADWRFLKQGTYKLSGGKSNKQTVYIIGQYIDGTSISNATVQGGVYDTGNGLTFTLRQDAYINYQVQISNGETIDDTFYPMIRFATDEDDTFEPYQGNLFSVEFPALGKNLCMRYTQRELNKGIYYDVTEEGIRVHGTATAASYSWTSVSNYENCLIHLPAGKYAFSVNDMIGANQQDAYVVFMGFDEDGTSLGNSVVMNGVTRAIVKTFDKPVGLYYGFFVRSGLTVDSVVKLQIETGASVTTYEPYTNTLYSGKVDFVTGNGVADMAMKDLGAMSWSYNSSVKFFQADLSGAATTTYTGIANAKCSIYPIGSIAAVRDGSTAGLAVNSAGYVYVRDSNYTDAASFKTAMDGVQLVYELATPILFTCSPQTIMSLVGENVVWSPDGEVTVVAKAIPET